jgi:amino-acid N-acetyltransferase
MMSLGPHHDGPPVAGGLFPIEGATPEDADGIARLLERSAPETIPMSAAELAERADEFAVMRAPDGTIVATAAIRPCPRLECELRSLAVDPDWRGLGLGARLVEHVKQYCASTGRGLMCVTIRPHFFARHGFRRVPLDRLPKKRSRKETVAGRPRVAMGWSPLDSAAPGSEAAVS